MQAFDMHIHSKYSFDSFLSPKRILRVAKTAKLKGVAITDHGTIQGGIEGRKIKSDVFVIVGAEIATEIGEITGLFLQEEIKSTKSLEVIDEIKDQDGIILLPHPFRGHKNLTKELLEKIDVIEVWNARASIEGNEKANSLARRLKKPICAGSDAHFACEIGKAKILISDVYTLEDVRINLLANENQIEGSYSPRYLEKFSQCIKAVKTKKIWRIPRLTAEIPLSMIRDNQ